MSIKLACWGWRYESWAGGVFYPDDLPADADDDWRLAYYANHFDSVVIPAAYWLDEALDVEQLLDDVHQEFSFIVDWPLTLSVDDEAYLKCHEFCQAAEAQLEAVLIDNTAWSQLDVEQQQRFTQLSSTFNIQQYGEGQSIADVGTVWVEQNTLPDASICMMPISDKEILRDLTGRLQSRLAAAPIEQLIVFPDRIAWSRIEEIKTVLQLLAG